MADNERVLGVIRDAVEEINSTLPEDQQLEFSEETALFGPSGALDSMGLVNFVVAVEQGLEEEFGVSVVLADEKAMSRRTSPFRTVGSLKDYIHTLLEEKQHV